MLEKVIENWTSRLDYIRASRGSPMHHSTRLGILSFRLYRNIVHTRHGSPVVKVTDSQLACHEFDPSTTEDPPCKEDRCTLNMSKLKCNSVGVVWKLGEEVPAQVLSSLRNVD
ncbi:hypothetical protein TNCV_4384961 [Trichonephila clavipes]|nr:hypothetical protein TNCV_4384961 [Trichonephila clavipes]